MPNFQNSKNDKSYKSKNYEKIFLSYQKALRLLSDRQLSDCQGCCYGRGKCGRGIDGRTNVDRGKDVVPIKIAAGSNVKTSRGK